jgi:seryl-tRNA synthetase
MLTLDFITKNFDLFSESMKKRGLDFSLSTFEKFDLERKYLISKTQELQEKKNKLAKEIGFKKSKGLNAEEEIKQSEEVKENLPKLEENLKDKENKIHNFLLTIPNILSSDVPFGKNEEDNKEVLQWGKRPSFDFTPKEHFDLLPEYLDFETATKISGSRFVLLKDKLAKLERALINFCLDENTKMGYQETSIPVLTKEDAFFGTGQLPKFEGDFFKTTDGYFLIPTSEVSLTNTVRESVIEEKHLPIRLTTSSLCFRSEAGSAGKDTRGMIRQHQFNKVELVTVCTPQNSEEEHQKMLDTAQNILQKLGICYRVVLLCGGDIGFSANKTFDIEVWLAGQGRFREIASISNTLSFQACRMNTRYKKAENKKNDFVHTLNGSSLAIGRLMVAILENYQTIDGKIKVPDALQSYINCDFIE